MAKIMTEEWKDDLDGGKAQATVLFGWEGTSYEVDLSHKNRKKYQDLLDPLIAVARIVKPTAVKRGRPASKPKAAANGNGHKNGGRIVDAGYTRKVREWATLNGRDVSSRGRLSRELIAAYDAAQSVTV